MSHPASSDGEVVAPTSLNEKHTAELAVSTITELQSFDIDAADLPPGYFRSTFFIGTAAATGLAMMTVSTPQKVYKEPETEMLSFRVSGSLVQ
jgi:hypothetical protein